MAEGTIKIKEMEELTELTDNDYFVVDNLQSGVPTKKYKATRVIQMIENVADEIEEKITPSIDTALAIGSASGDIASFSDGSNLPMPKLQVGIEPVQDLHGYDSPWIGGSGKNLLAMTVDKIKALNSNGVWNGNAYTWRGITYTILTDNANNVIGIDSDGTASERGWLYLSDNNLGSTSVSFNGATASGYIWTSGNSTQINNEKEPYYNGGSQKSYLIIGNGITTNHDKWYPMARLATETDATFEPYSNICPISGHTEANIVVSPTEDAEDGTTYTIQFKDGDNPLTVYSGTLDVVSGELKVVPYYASYNGETLEGEWISDRDVYAVGATPTIGAQVVNIGAIPITYQLTPTQVKSLLGSNNVWADTGKIIDCEYKRDATAIINSLIARIEALENQ